MGVANSAIFVEAFTLGYTSEVRQAWGVYQVLDKGAWHCRHSSQQLENSDNKTISVAQSKNLLVSNVFPSQT